MALGGLPVSKGSFGVDTCDRCGEAFLAPQALGRAWIIEVDSHGVRRGWYWCPKCWPVIADLLRENGAMR